MVQPGAAVADQHLGPTQEPDELRPRQVGDGRAPVLLDRIHDLFLLRDHRCAEFSGPVRITAHGLDHLGIVEKAKNAGIPILARAQSGAFLLFLEKQRGLAENRLAVCQALLVLD